MAERLLPPSATATDRLKATINVADKLCAQLREGELMRTLWGARPEAIWDHDIKSSGWIVSNRSVLKDKEESEGSLINRNPIGTSTQGSSSWD